MHIPRAISLYIKELRESIDDEIFTAELRHKVLQILPHFFTLINAVLGYLAIAYASNASFVVSGYMILFAALFDAIDGRVARLFKVSSELGLYLDSFSDAISFCLAPAMLSYLWHMEGHGPIAIVPPILFFLSGIIRLAKFNMSSSQQTRYFIGMPTTVAACFLVLTMLTLYSYSINLSGKALFSFGTLMIALALLMVSKIPFRTFKELTELRDKKVFLLFFFTLLVVAISANISLSLFIFFLFYIFGSLFVPALFSRL